MMDYLMPPHNIVKSGIVGDDTEIGHVNKALAFIPTTVVLWL